MSHSDPVYVAAEIERVLASVATFDNPRDADRTRELAELIMSLYASGLSRVVEIARAQNADALLDRLAADPLVSSLLALHGLHPDPPEQRIGRALDAIAPALPPGARATVIATTDDCAHVGVAGLRSGHGDYAAIRRAIEHAVQEAAPEMGTIRIDGLQDSLLQIIRPSHSAVATR